MKITPSQHPFSCFVLCEPTYANTKIKNNAWMTDLNAEEVKQDPQKFLGQWRNLYDVLSANALVYLIPPKKGLQDQTYVNSFVVLHDGVNVILSNFTAPGRAGEEIVAGRFLKQLGYNVVKSPYKFEGCPELKYSGKENIYYGGYGIRTDKRTYDWMEKEFDIKIIRLMETDKYLYHLDCSLFVLNKDNVMIYDEHFTKTELKQIEKLAEIHPISIEAAYQGGANSVRVSDFVLNASSLDFMKPTDKWYKEEVQKNDELEAICQQVGLELIYVDLSESMKGGALLSCHCGPLNYKDYQY